MMLAGLMFLVFLSASVWRHLWLVAALSAVGLFLECVWIARPSVLVLDETAVSERGLLARPWVFALSACGEFALGKKSIIGPPKVVFEYQFPLGRGSGGRRVQRQAGQSRSVSFYFRYEDAESNLVDVLNQARVLAIATIDGR
jgi:hypothetical protein